MTCCLLGNSSGYNNGMKKIYVLIALLTLVAACSGTPTNVVTVPTLAVLPSTTATLTSTLTATPSPTETPTSTLTPSSTPAPTDTATPVPSATFTLTVSSTATATATSTQTYTFTPSQTITDTITPTPSPTFTASPELDSLGLLALLSQRATVLPPNLRYNPPTLTAVAFAAQTLIAAQNAPTEPDNGPTPLAGAPQLATLPPPLTLTCSTTLPGGLAGAFASDPTLTQSIGCPQGASFSTTTAVEGFEHGTMIYVQGSPNEIYVLTLDNRFERFDDTWVQGVDPETTGLTPPSGLLEPKRGFGKVWRNNLEVRGSLGWAMDSEQGSSATMQAFDHGRALFLPQRGQTYLLIDDPGGLTGLWRTLAASF